MVGTNKKHWRFSDGDGNGVGYDDGGGDGDGVAFGVCDDGGNGHPCNLRQCDALFIGTAWKPQIPETQRAFCVLDLNAKNLHDGWLVLMVRFSTIILFPPVLIWLCSRSWRANYIGPSMTYLVWRFTVSDESRCTDFQGRSQMKEFSKIQWLKIVMGWMKKVAAS